MRCAVIDLGTNTFHLLVAEHDDQQPWQTVLKERRYIKMAEQGIHRIGPAAFERGIQALRHFKQELDAAGVPPERVRAIGTAALRTAENAADFVSEVQQQTGIRAEVISGDREAELIYKGVRQAVPFPDEGRVLIMDIGGGSVEFILADREKVFWQKSFPIGVAVLFQRFQHSDPIAEAEIQAEENYLDAALAELWAALGRWPAVALVGASGTFDVIDNFLLDPTAKPLLYGYTTRAALDPLCDMFIKSTLAERHAMPLLAPERVEMIVAAIILIRVVLQKAGLNDIYTSAYAMKEGMLEELAAQVFK
ncbi:MAG: hypothetical protein U0U46_04945 [Saprospiraceae bacterium]|nr:hypothetical protein [Saprospiraceae bacterium]